ncbi:MAG TPA: hypothetical protein VIP46_08865, partial [Pyrinomonadaceae bacterium]
GVLLERAADIVPTVKRLATDARLYAQMRAATAGIAFPNSTRRIVEEITALIPAHALGAEEPARVERIA